LIYAYPLSNFFTSVSRISNGSINKAARFLLVFAITATLVAVVAAQTNNVQEAATQTSSFQGLGQNLRAR
jgi:hypothetical protein